MVDSEPDRLASKTFFYSEHEVAGEIQLVCEVNYLALLNLDSEDISLAIDGLRTLLAGKKTDEIQADTIQLLQARNWRPHLIACGVMLTGHTSARILEAAWDRIRQGSWVVPQLVATCHLVDKEFAIGASEVLRSYWINRRTLRAIHAVGKDVLDLNLPDPMTTEPDEFDRSGEIAVRWSADAKRLFGVVQ